MSKFDNLFAVRKEKSGTPAPETSSKQSQQVVKKQNKAPFKIIGIKEDFTEEKASPQTSMVTERGPGRPSNGKRKDPNYIAFTTLIRKDTHTSVKIALLQEGKNRELSELVEELLSTWVNKQRL